MGGVNKGYKESVQTLNISPSHNNYITTQLGMNRKHSIQNQEITASFHNAATKLTRLERCTYSLEHTHISKMFRYLKPLLCNKVFQHGL